MMRVQMSLTKIHSQATFINVCIYNLKAITVTVFSSEAASASRRLVLPELGGPRRSVILQFTQPMDIRSAIT